MALVACLTLNACALWNTTYTPEPIKSAEAWSLPIPPISSAARSASDWWTALGDPAINALIAAAMEQNPTLKDAQARIEAAQAQLDSNQARLNPTLAVKSEAARNFDGSPAAGATTGVAANYYTTQNVQPTMHWELDLFGRLSASEEAASRRMNSQIAEADGTKLILASQIASFVLDLKACSFAAQKLTEELSSTTTTASLVTLQHKVGMVEVADMSAASQTVSAKERDLAQQLEQCSRDVNALVYLTGRNIDDVRRITAVLTTDSHKSTLQHFLPAPPNAYPQLPANVLQQHYSIRAADHAAAAAWAEIDAARANRLPKLELSSLFTGQWISAAGSTLNYTAWGLGAALSANVYDGGAGAAEVSAAQARYRQAAANLEDAVRTVVKETENALAHQENTQKQYSAALKMNELAQQTYQANEQKLQAGMISKLEVENAHRQLLDSEILVVNTQRDRAKAWIELIKATDNAVNIQGKI